MKVQYSKLPTFSRLKNEFNVSTSEMLELRKSFLKELTSGIKGEPSSFAMLPSFITQLPTPEIKGEYVGLDFGGTNFRAVRYFFDGNGGSRIIKEIKAEIPNDVKISSKQEDLFDFFANVTWNLLQSNSDNANRIGFTFSFSIKQNSIRSGDLLLWNKGFEVGGVVGKDVVCLLEQAFKRRGLTNNNKIEVLTSDSVGVLASGKFSKANCVLGVILGTGTNAAYIEKNENIMKLSSNTVQQSKSMAINVEWGAFGDLSKNLPRTVIDIDIDEASHNIGHQSFEKMISGYYLGELVRRIILYLAANGEIFCNETNFSDKLRIEHGLKSVLLTKLDPCNSPSALYESFEKFQATYEINELSQNDKALISEICRMVITRAAKLTAVGISALLCKMKRDDQLFKIPGVGIDGSVFERTPMFQEILATSIKDLKTDCEIYIAKDGSGKGAALLAAAATNNSHF